VQVVSMCVDLVAFCVCFFKDDEEHRRTISKDS